VNGSYGHLLPDIPPGDNYLFYTDKRGHPDPQFGWRSRYWSFLLKLAPDKPAPTIQAQPGPYVGPFHWENRRLRIGELKRLFTFPDEFEFVGSRASRQAQVGNSVPPLLAEQVVRAVTAKRRATGRPRIVAKPATSRAPKGPLTTKAGSRIPRGRRLVEQLELPLAVTA
jgi:DNA (cytosine-5)-methyltransferase 1